MRARYVELHDHGTSMINRLFPQTPFTVHALFQTMASRTVTHYYCAEVLCRRKSDISDGNWKIDYHAGQTKPGR